MVPKSTQNWAKIGPGTKKAIFVEYAESYAPASKNKGLDTPKFSKIRKNLLKIEDKTATRKKEGPESDFEPIWGDFGIPWGSQNR